LRTKATHAGALGRGAERWRSFDDQPVSAEVEKPFCALNCAAVRPLLRQASTRSRQRASRSGLRVRMRVPLRQERDAGNDADSRSAYRASSSGSSGRSRFLRPKSNRERALGDAGTREGWQQGAESETTPIHAAHTLRIRVRVSLRQRRGEARVLTQRLRIRVRSPTI
jgi:hypothetical protein